MQENYELVQKGFRILLPAMSEFICRELRRVYRNDWWNETLYVLADQRDLPVSGSYEELVNSLDVANCIRLIDRRWNDVFRNKLSLNCRTWAKELMGVRNNVSHIGQKDMDQPAAERALDTMALLCKEIAPQHEAEIREIYAEVRARSDSSTGIATLSQPTTDSKRGALTEGSLLQLLGTDAVQATQLSRKVTYNGKTKVYPVYRVRLDMLYYNDQNDRIATWISRYEAENGDDALCCLNREEYNQIIEEFVYESNSEAILKTQRNIAMMSQREPGVTLSDGRIVDGNRRFTCLRRIQRESNAPIYFETVLMDADIQEDRKQIKLLELAIQHGEEKKVDYDLIDFAVGTYRDVVLTKLLTVEEYAQSTNESVADVKKRIDTAELVSEFLAYIKLPEQYHVAREYQVYSLFLEMLPCLKQLDSEEQVQLKNIAFHNVMMHAIADQRKFIRDIKGLVRNETYGEYFEDQQKWSQEIQKLFSKVDIRSKADIDAFAENHSAITEELQASMEKALQRSRSKQLKAKPAENVSKSISLLMDVDPRLFGKLDPDEKDTLKAELEELIRLAEGFRKKL